MNQSVALQQQVPLLLFYATFDLPGLHDSMRIWAVDQADAERQAEQLAREPWRDWPSPDMRKDMKIAVRLAVQPGQISPVTPDALDFLAQRVSDARRLLDDPRSTPRQRALATRVLAGRVEE